MNIVIISTYDVQGGAARAAYRLHQGLQRIGQRSSLLVQSKSAPDPSVTPVETEGLLSMKDRLLIGLVQRYALDLNRTELSDTRFSMPYPGYDLSTNDRVRRADILNLHWVAGFQSVETIGRLLRLGKKVVWTLHDANPFTGGCHYTAGCRRFQDGCEDCPQLIRNEDRLPAMVLSDKGRHWMAEGGGGANLTIVTPSRWLARDAASSRLFQGLRVEVIPNSLETDCFRPLDKAAAKVSLGVDPGKTCILFSAERHAEKRKGLSELLGALELCLDDQRFRSLLHRERIELLAVGEPQPSLACLGIPTRSFGYVRSDELLARIYSAADLFALPSREDNLPNTMLEAMACGTPVVAFSVGGMPDLIEDGRTGRLVSPFSVPALARALLSLILDPVARARLGGACRAVIEQGYRLEDQAAAYLRLFGKLRGSDEPAGIGLDRESAPAGPGMPAVLAGSGKSSAVSAAELFQCYLRAARQTIDRRRFDPSAAGPPLRRRVEALVLRHSDSWWTAALAAAQALVRRGRAALSRRLSHGRV